MTETIRTEFTPQEQQIIELEQADRNLEHVRRGWRGSHRTTDELLDATQKRNNAVLATIKAAQAGTLTEVQLSVEKSFSKLRLILPPTGKTPRDYPMHILVEINQLAEIDPNIRDLLPVEDA